MKKKTLLSVLLVSVFLLSGITVVAFAGLDPGPFKPEINKLGAIENSLNSIHERVKKVLGYPPDPYNPGPNVKGAVGRLYAMENQLELMNDFTLSVIEEVLDIPPDPVIPVEVRPALEAVRDSAQGIADEIKAFLNIPPDPYIPEFSTALEAVQNSAQVIADNVNDYLNSPGS